MKKILLKNGKIMLSAGKLSYSPKIVANYESAGLEQVFQLAIPNFACNDVEEFPEYDHWLEPQLNMPNVNFYFQDIDQYPTYIQGGPGLPIVNFDFQSVDQYPTYIQNTITNLVFDTISDSSIQQWTKFNKVISPLSGSSPYSYTVTGLPVGLSHSVSGDQLIINGIPQEFGDHEVVLNVTDNAGDVVNVSFMINVVENLKIPIIENTLLPEFNANRRASIIGYNFDITGILMFNDIDITTSVVQWSDSVIDFLVPIDSVGSCNLYVISNGQNSTVINKIVIGAL